jgi:hypothetical protein
VICLFIFKSVKDRIHKNIDCFVFYKFVKRLLSVMNHYATICPLIFVSYATQGKATFCDVSPSDMCIRHKLLTRRLWTLRLKWVRDSTLVETTQGVCLCFGRDLLRPSLDRKRNVGTTLPNYRASHPTALYC